MPRVYLYRRFERFWHWAQALLVIGLAITGFDLHFESIALLSFEQADDLHRTFAWAFVVLIAFAIFWHFTTGEWRQYLPTRKYLKEMVTFYITGIFRNTPHPHRRTRLTKLNPLQRLAYLGLKLLIIPVLVTTGFLYYFYNDWPAIGLDWLPLGAIATIHTAAAYLMMAFMFAHIYLTTTGETPSAHIRAMITGWEELPEHDRDTDRTSDTPSQRQEPATG